MGMEHGLRRRYLHALGVQVWRSRAAGGPLGGEVGLAVTSVGDPESEGVGAGLVAADAAGAILAGSGEPPPTPAEVPRSLAGGAVAEMDWETLKAAVATCRGCGLWETRTQTVFGVGNREADLMIIGEAPGFDEDRAGEPFVGRAGRLLNLMLAAIGLRRDQVYIANILKCRPPGNRDPSPDEALRCEPYLLRQIELVRPRLVLSLGRISAQNLLHSGTPLRELRGQWFELGPAKTPLFVTYHPAYLLRSPDQKGVAWQDLQRVARRLRDLQNLAAGCGGGP